MKIRIRLLCMALFALFLFRANNVQAQKATDQQIQQLYTADMNLTKAQISYDKALDQLVFKMVVVGQAGDTKPEPAGQLNGAPVLGYVFPTTLKPTAVGFGDVEGILAFAVTSHPDFDDTPLWDENGDHKYKNDGLCYHTHWVVLVNDNRVAGGLSVKGFQKGDESVMLPPTNPGMPIYLDSPGFPVIFNGNTLKIPVPANRVSNKISFNYDGVAAYMEVSTEPGQPMLGVYKVYEVLSGDLSLPYTVQQ